jgi:hypothetical protein
LRYALVIAALLAPSPLLAQDLEDAPAVRDRSGPGFELSTGLDFEQGDYGTGSDIEKLSVPVTARLSTGRVHASAQLPWVRVTAPGNVIAPTGPLGLPILVDPTRPAEVTTREGLGDLRLGLAYDLSGRGVIGSVRSGVKLPTASASKGLGTGETDYSVGADLAKPIGPVTPFVGVTYTMPGDPEGLDLRNSVSGHAGAALRLGGTTTAHVGYGYAESSSDLVEDEQRVFGGVNTAVGGGVSLGLYGSGGLSDSAPDVGAGVTLGLSFGR